MMNKKRFKLVFVLCFLIANSFAQNNTHTRQLNLVDSTGYYQVKLTPEVLGVAKLNFADLRVWDHTNTEQAYFIKKESFSEVTSGFKKYPILENNVVPKGFSTLIFENKNRKNLNKIGLEIKNAQVRKQLTISGSNDKTKWFVVKENHFINGIRNDKNTSDILYIHFPTSDYAYYKLTFNDSTSLPLRILSVGNDEQKKHNNQFTSFVCPIVYGKDTAKQTIIKIKHDTPVFMEQLNIYVSGDTFYKRKMEARIMKKRKVSKKKWVNYYQSFLSGQINSGNNETFWLGYKQLQDWELVINNEDNKPLQIDSIVASYANRYIVTKLEANKTYKITFGNNKLKLPNYDLKHFKNKITPIGTVLLQEKEEEEKEATKIKKEANWTDKHTLWLIIALVGVLILFVVFKVVREIK